MSEHHETAKLTRNQQLVFDALSDSKTPLSAYTLLDQLRSSGFRAPLQVYRALEKLIDNGQVHRLESLNSFVACQHSNCGQHKTIAFTICDSCDRVSEFTDSQLSNLLQSISADSHFKLENSVVELRGKCEQCAELKPQQ